MILETDGLSILEEALKQLENGFLYLPQFKSHYDYDKLRSILIEIANKLHDNYPYFHPLYAGQMLKPPHPVARLAYMLSLWINPNNHAIDGGRASSAMEKEAVAQIAGLFGWQKHLGHLCSGGTMANLEALWVSGKLKHNTTIIASEQAHYTHKRISEVLRLNFRSVSCDNKARMDINDLEEILKKIRDVTVVATIGTTGTGSIDPLPDILKLKEKYDFRLHVDAAYGGYFILANNLSNYAKKVFQHISNIDSIVVDPHKHGLQPYGCGCIIFRDPAVGTFYKHDSPYTYFSSPDLHLGEISLECSRPGASAVALWATQKLLPMTTDGEFAHSLSKSRSAALSFYNKLHKDYRFITIMEPELDIVVWAPHGKKISTISNLSKIIFEKCAEQNLHFATFNFPAKLLKNVWNNVEFDQDYVTCLRSCLMKPEHFEWIDNIYGILDDVVSKLHV